MRDLFRKLSKAGDLEMDLCAGTCSTTKSCVLFEQHRKLVENDVDTELLRALEAELTIAVLFQMLNPKSSIIGSSNVEVSAKFFSAKTGAFLTRKKSTVWDFPPGMSAA